MTKQQRKRAAKGSVTVHSRGKQLQIRWSIDGDRFYLAAGLNTPINLDNAQKLASTIHQDILLSQFDPTLEKYKPKLIEPEPVKLSMVKLFERFIEYRRRCGTSDQAISTRYNALLANLQRFERGIESESDARKFVDLLRSRQSPVVATKTYLC